MLLDFAACTSLTLSSLLAYVSPHPMPDKMVTNEFDTGVGARVLPRMVQVEHVKAHDRRNTWGQAAVTCIAQQANTVIKEYCGYF